MNVNQPSPSVSWWARRSFPIWFVALVWIVGDFASLSVFESFRLRGSLAELVRLGLAGAVTGQCCFVATVSGLRWQTWGTGLAIGTVLASIGVLMFSAGAILFMYIAGYEFEYAADLVSVVGVVPGLLLSMMLPLIALRYVFGWRLVASDEAVPRKESFRIEDMLSMTATIAASLVLMRLVPVIHEPVTSDFWGVMLGFSTVAFAIGLLILPICIRLVFGTRTAVRSLVGLSILAVVIPLGIWCTFQFEYPLEVMWALRFESLAQILAATGGAIGASYVSLLLLAWCGISLARGDQPITCVASTSPIPDPPAQPYRSTRWVTATFVILAIICSIGLGRLEAWREKMRVEFDRLEAMAATLGGTIDTEDYRVGGLELGGPATDHDLEHFRHCRHIESIDLSGSQVTNRGLEKLTYFPQTKILYLNNTRITNDGLTALNDLNGLAWLYLNDTRIDGRGIAQIRSSLPLRGIELNNTPIDDLGCQELSRFQDVYFLSLSGTQITDQGLRHLSALKSLCYLLLGETRVTGDGLSNLTQLRWLKLNGSEVNDTTIRHITGMNELWELDLRHTAITDIGLEQLRKLPDLGKLQLDDTAVTGDGFRNWDNQAKLGWLGQLSLARTALNDAGVKHLRCFSNLRSLDLSETQISDACLNDLAAMRIVELNLSHTKITSAAVLKAGIANVQRLLFAADQFTAAELATLRAQMPGSHVVVVEKELED